ncbi:MAG: hypothetical protein LAP87_07855 [Acidobacteriia bacterium]|nr:hypothetical protein [Terriglobia bacterium]
MDCAICHTRRARRFCPGVRGDICSICCGTEREVTVNCPLDCEFLQAARKQPQARPEGEIPNRDIQVTENLLQNNQDLLVCLASILTRSALQDSRVVDSDVREALDALIRTYRTLESGIYYESRPDNLPAARLYSAVQDGVARFRREETEHLGMSKTRDADVLGLLAFVRRIEFERNNRRPLGRAFLDALLGLYSAGPALPAAPAPPGSSLLLP